MEIRIQDEKRRIRVERLNRSIATIGAHPDNDIVLNVDTLQAFHFQITNNPQLDNPFRIINLTDIPAAITIDHEAYWLDAYASSRIQDGDSVEIGGYKLVFQIPMPDGLLNKASSFQAEIEMPASSLPVNSRMEGFLVIRNTGGQSACQFTAVVEGIPDNCYLLDSIPLLYPNAEEKIPFNLLHRGTEPEAGLMTFYVQIESPNHYPGEKLTLKYTISVAPNFQQKLEIQEKAGRSHITVSKAEQKKPQKLVQFDKETKNNQTPVPSEYVFNEEETLPEEILEEKQEINTHLPLEEMEEKTETDAEEKIPQASETEEHASIETDTTTKDPVKMKIIRDQFTDFWEDE